MPARFLDSTAPFDFAAKNGYYQVGNSYCLYAITAYQEASRTKQPVEWKFNNEVYDNLDWRSRLNLPIGEIYRLRAQQLRDKYDYLILWFSGGADSTVILQTFVENNIHLDEVMIVWPISQTQGKYTPNTAITSAENMVSEWDFSIKPKLDWLAKNHPNIKITVLDQLATDNFVEDHADTWTLVEKHGVGATSRQRLLDAELKERYKKHNNIACICGVGAPQITIVDNLWLSVNFTNFTASAGMAKSDYLLDGTPRNVECFYWTPDFPEILREQAHLILDHINWDPSCRSLLLQMTCFPHLKTNLEDIVEFDLQIERSESRRDLIKKIVYPTWDQNTFQAAKPKNGYLFSTQYGAWLYSQENIHLFQSWSASMRAQYSMIDESLVPRRKNYILFNADYPWIESKYYPVGRLKN